jgi:hypothetical protein
MTFGVRITRGMPGQSVTTDGSFSRISRVHIEVPGYVGQNTKAVKAYLHKP